MHFNHGRVPDVYIRYTRRKTFFIAMAFLALAGAVTAGISLGTVHVGVPDMISSLLGQPVSRQVDLIVRQIRLPRVLAAVAAGAGLAGAGTVMQSVLRNPLASPFTLGISHAAAFGAAFSVSIQGNRAMADRLIVSGTAATMVSAFFFAMVTACLIIYIARSRGASPEVMVLTGVALGTLFTAGTMLLQFFADDVQLAAMVFWTFGDVARASWSDLLIFSAVTLVILGFFLLNVWNYNTMEAGDETAQGLGVRVEIVRLAGMMAASLVTAVIISFVGIIGFVGLVAPHMVRRIIGDDHRFLMPAAILAGALLLLLSDIAARLAMQPHVLPVSIFTAFLGAPVFMALIVKGYKSHA